MRVEIFTQPQAFLAPYIHPPTPLFAVCVWCIAPLRRCLNGVASAMSADRDALVADHARFLGVDPRTEQDLVELVEAALVAPLPEPWLEKEDDYG